MIYSYTYLPEKIVKAQAFVNYIVLEVLCLANRQGMPKNFDHNLVIQKYKPLIRDINDEYIKNPLDKAYQICQNLSSFELKILRRAIHQNTNILGICDGTVKPVLYSQVKLLNKDLANHLYIFCKLLYTHVMSLKPFISLFGELKVHYNNFAQKNGFKSKRCAFCGSARMLNEYHTKKEAYDHYFPKEQYPFISIHFLNLAPMCHTCNSSYKSRKNPIDIKKNGLYKKVFFPFKTYGRISFNIALHNINIEKIKPHEIEISHSLAGHNEEVSSWESIFGIKERYLAIYSGDGFNWFEETRIATAHFGETYQQYKENLDTNYFSNENFLKLAFFEACEKIDLTS